MSPEQKRKFNTTFGAIFMTTGLAAWGLTAWFAITPNPPKPAPVINAAVIDLASCSQALRHMDYEVSVKDKDVIAFQSLKTAPKEQLQEATVAATMCRLPLKSFCMGEGCERPGMTIVVSAGDDAKRTPSATPPAPAATEKK